MHLQFRVLYREFLFRVVDLEMLAERADVSHLLGQIGALLGAFSFMLSLAALRMLVFTEPSPARLTIGWQIQLFLFSTTMLVVGLFAVLSWDSTFPDRRDVLVLAPLPVRARTLFCAKLAAVGSVLGVTVAAINCGAGLTFPLLFIPLDGGVPAGLRSLAAYWITALGAGTFLFCSLLALQGLSAQLLPRRYFLRWSAFLQMAAFGGILGVYCLQPYIATPAGFASPDHQTLLAFLPAYWFVGLFHALNGDLPAVLAPLARRAVIGLAVAVSGGALAFLLSYFRTLRKTVEEPDILPGRHRPSWRPWLGDPLRTAVVLFSWRTLLRSRQHRVILAGYLGIGMAIAFLSLRSLINGGAADPWWNVNMPILISSVVLLCFAVVGVRAVFALPLALRANWIFRVTSVYSAGDYLRAVWIALYALTAAPIVLLFAAILIPVWPAAPTAGHLLLLALFGAILVHLALHSFRKVPFTCAYLPGKGNIHVSAGAYIGVLTIFTGMGVRQEWLALSNPRLFVKFALALCFMALLAWWRMRRNRRGAVVQFDEAPDDVVLNLGLRRDGVIPD